MKKIIKLVLILGILVFSMSNLVQAQEDRYLCCPTGTDIEPISQLCYGFTEFIQDGKKITIEFYKSDPRSTPFKALEAEDCKNIPDRTKATQRLAADIVDWRIVKTISESRPRQDTTNLIRSIFKRLAPGTSRTPTTTSEAECPRVLALVKLLHNGDFTSEEVCLEDTYSQYYDCGIIKRVGGEEITVFCPEGFRPQTGSQRATTTKTTKITEPVKTILPLKAPAKIGSKAPLLRKILDQSKLSENEERLRYLKREAVRLSIEAKRVQKYLKRGPISRAFRWFTEEGKEDRLLTEEWNEKTKNFVEVYEVIIESGTVQQKIDANTAFSDLASKMGDELAKRTALGKIAALRSPNVAS